MQVKGHLPLHWRLLGKEEAECVRSLIMDRAVARSWTAHPEGHVSVSEEMAPVVRRLNEIEQKIDRLQKHLDRTGAPPLPTRPLTLGTGNCVLTPLPEEVFPPAGDWVEIRFVIPPENEDEILVLGQSTGNGAFEFTILAQDQMDRLVRYLLNRQRLAQDYPHL